MAKLTIDDLIDYGGYWNHDATTWQVAEDPEFTRIIDESIQDTVNVKYWYTMLPKIDSSGYYADLTLLYARAKVHIGHIVSPWFILEPKTQNTQAVIVTEDGQEDILTDSATINMQ